MRVELGNQRTSIVYQQLLLGRQTKSSWLWEPLSQRLTALRWTQHSINRNLSCTACGIGDLEKKIGGDSHPLMIWCGFNVSLHISCCGKSKTKILLNNFLIFNQMLTYSQNTHSMNMRWLFFFKLLKIKRHQYPFIYVLKVSYNHQ